MTWPGAKPEEQLHRGDDRDTEHPGPADHRLGGEHRLRHADEIETVGAREGPTGHHPADAGRRVRRGRSELSIGSRVAHGHVGAMADEPCSEIPTLPSERAHQGASAIEAGGTVGWQRSSEPFRRRRDRASGTGLEVLAGGTHPRP